MLDRTAIVLTLAHPEKKQRVWRNTMFLQKHGYNTISISPYEKKLDLRLFNIGILSLARSLIINLLTCLLPNSSLLHLYLCSLKYSLSINTINELSFLQPSVVLVEEIELIPIGIYIKKSSANTRLILDLRDLYICNYTASQILYRLFKTPAQILAALQRNIFYRKYLRQCDSIMIVNQSLCRLLDKHYACNASVVYNYPCLKQISSNISISNKSPVIKFVYHGLGLERRGLIDLIKAFQAVYSEPIRISLDLYLVSMDASVRYYLESISSSHPNIKLQKPLDPTVLIKQTAHYDVGIVAYPPSDTSMQYSLPNKFFEYIHAGLAVMVSTSVELIDITNKYDIGLYAQDFNIESLTFMIKSFTYSNLERMRINARATSKYFTFESQNDTLKEVFFGE